MFKSANLFAVLGVMGFAGVALDSTMMMIGAVVIGIAVDDTLRVARRPAHGPRRLDRAARGCATNASTGRLAAFEGAR